MEKLLSKPKVISCILAISIIGLLTMMILYSNWDLDRDFITIIKEIVFVMPIIFTFLLIGVTYINYEGSRTPKNIAINISFHVFLILAFISLILLIHTIDQNKKAKQEMLIEKDKDKD